MQTVFLALSALVAVVSAQVPVRLVGGPLPANPPLCLAAASNADGASIALAQCNNLGTTFPNGNLTWVIPSPLGTSGQVTTFNGTKCLDVRDGLTTNGNLVQAWSCATGNTNQLWQYNGGSTTVSWVGQNKCLDIRDGNLAAGALVQIWDCIPGNTNQLWFASLLG
ncbi:hypothetical protein E1B28_012015 [Marasmius oreades]|uniref:Ricin B lectin domain-containing protein n=1 Tax=Marasmius oreades TaxID=181124 RepID=A0A9P7RQR9_9AGAR|nr:uncharacterized protein E1B28_012015 [Marasmius oreades]KAG7087975.1 hypothetical protein E1B28_012015 [Marasmius oreades]